MHAGEDTISFHKDDDDALDFITAALNHLSAVYYIECKMCWEVKGALSGTLVYALLTVSHTEMMGNIIPANAMINAIMSELFVLQSGHLLRNLYMLLNNMHSTVQTCHPSQLCP